MNKRSRKKAVIIQSIGGYINTMISMLQGLLLLPFYFKYITYEVYGYYITIVSIISILSIVNFGIGTMVMQRISSAYSQKNFKLVVNYFFNSLLVYVLISIVFIFLSLIGSFWIENIITVNDENFNILLKIYFIVMLTVILAMYNSSFKGFSQALLNPIFAIVSTVLSRLIGLSIIIFMMLNGYGLISIPIGLLMTEIFIFSSNGIFVFFIYKNLNIKANIDKNILKEYFTMSPHLFGLIIGNKLSSSSHPIIITIFLGAEMTTAYTIVRRAAEIIIQMLTVINASLIGPFSHLVGEGSKDKIKVIVSKIILISFGSSVIMFCTYIVSNKLFVNLWIGDNIALTNEVIVFIGLSFILYSMTRLFRSLLFGFNKIEFASKIILFEGLGFIILAITCIKYLGIVSIPFSLFLVSSIFSLILYLRILKEINQKIIYLNILVFFTFAVSIALYVLFMYNFKVVQESDIISFLLTSIYTISGIFLIEVLYIKLFNRGGVFLSEKK